MNTTSSRPEFDRILDMEDAVRLSSAARVFQLAGVSDHKAGQQSVGVAADKARLAAAIDALTPEQMAEFGAYRQAARA